MHKMMQSSIICLPLDPTFDVKSYVTFGAHGSDILLTDSASSLSRSVFYIMIETIISSGAGYWRGT